LHQREEVLDRMVAALRPGGWMLLDERRKEVLRVERWQPLPPAPRAWA
jgi:hypothetical protein